MQASTAIHVNIKSFNLTRSITDSNLFSKIKIKPVARLIIFNLANMYNPKLGYTFPGIEKLANCSGYSERQIKAGLKELSEQGLIVKTERKIYFTRKFYELVDVIGNENISPTSEDSSQKSENTSSKNELNSLPILNLHDSNRKITDNLNKPVKNKILNFEPRQNINQTEKERTKKLLEEKRAIKRGSPLDYNFDQAKEYLSNLPAILQNSYFAIELRKKWIL